MLYRIKEELKNEPQTKGKAMKQKRTIREVIGTVIFRGVEVVAQVDVDEVVAVSSYYLGNKGYAGKHFFGPDREAQAMAHAKAEAQTLLAQMRGKSVVTGMIDGRSGREGY